MGSARPAVATAASWMSSLRRKLFKPDQEPEAAEEAADLEKVEGVLGATATRLNALESTLFAFKSDVQYRQQLQQEAAIRLSHLEGMLMDAEDGLMEHARRARELDAELCHVERLMGPEAIKRGRDRRIVDARGSRNAQAKDGWQDKFMTMLPL